MIPRWRGASVPLGLQGREASGGRCGFRCGPFGCGTTHRGGAHQFGQRLFVFGQMGDEPTLGFEPGTERLPLPGQRRQQQERAYDGGLSLGEGHDF